VLRWCAANVVKDTDAGGRIKPSKTRSTERIDGISALVTGLRGITAAKESDRSRLDRDGEEVVVL
jgi:phage terminase large subunit-like protein